MPASFKPVPTPPQFERPHQGGLPPRDRFPLGGGGGGGEGHSGPEHGPREALRRFRVYLAVGILSDQLVFLLMTVLFFARKGATQTDLHTLRQISDWTPVHLPLILYPATLLLLASSYTIERARRHIFREMDVLEEWLGLGQPALTASRRWLIASSALGILFLAGLWRCASELSALGIHFGQSHQPAGTFVWLFLSAYALHLVATLAAVLFCCLGAAYLKRIEWRQIAIDATAWIWQTMVVAWVAIFLLLRLAQ